jgi:predicted nucleotidyltransferase
MEGEFIDTLPPNVGHVLTGFVEAARSAFGHDLRAVVLYGSGAEGKLRATSDVNVLLVLSEFDRKKADQLREPLRLAQAAIRLRAMFLLESELHPVMQAFAVKFADILRRRRVLYGNDPFEGISISRGDAIVRLKQTLLNLTLRLREAYIARRLLDDHLHDVPDPVYDLLVEVGAHTPRALTVILERDGDFPSIGCLLDQLDRARLALARGSAKLLDASKSVSQKRGGAIQCREI